MLARDNEWMTSDRINIDKVLTEHIQQIIFFQVPEKDQSLIQKHTMLCLKFCNIAYRVHPYQDISQWSHTHHVSHKYSKL